MIGLVETLDGICALADIKSVQHVDRVEGRAEQYVLHRHSVGVPMKMFAHGYRELEARPVQIIPAEPGTKLIRVFGGLSRGEVPVADKSPILAWAICVDGLIRPVTPSGVSRGFNPDGKADWFPDYVEMASGGIYELGNDGDFECLDNVDEVIAREHRREQQYAADRAERVAATAERADA